MGRELLLSLRERGWHGQDHPRTRPRRPLSPLARRRPAREVHGHAPGGDRRLSPSRRPARSDDKLVRPGGPHARDVQPDPLGMDGVQQLTPLDPEWTPPSPPHGRPPSQPGATARGLAAHSRSAGFACGQGCSPLAQVRGVVRLAESVSAPPISWRGGSR